MAALPTPEPEPLASVQDNVIYVLPPWAVRPEAVAAPAVQFPGFAERLSDLYWAFRENEIVDTVLFEAKLIAACVVIGAVSLGGFAGLYVAKCGADLDLVPGFSLGAGLK